MFPQQSQNKGTTAACCYHNKIVRKLHFANIPGYWIINIKLMTLVDELTTSKAEADAVMELLRAPEGPF